MKIHRIYNAMNEISDISGDIVKITMSAETWNLVQETVWQATLKDFPHIIDERQAKRLEKIFKQAELEATTEWKK